MVPIRTVSTGLRWATGHREMEGQQDIRNSAKKRRLGRYLQTERSPSSGGVERPDFGRVGAQLSTLTSGTFWSPSATRPVLYW